MELGLLKQGTNVGPVRGVIIGGRQLATAASVVAIGILGFWMTAIWKQAVRDKELIAAARQNNLMAASRLLSLGANPNAIEVGSGHDQFLESLKSALRRNTSRLHSNSAGSSVLMVSLDAWWKPTGGTDMPADNAAVVKLLVDSGADVHYKDRGGVTPAIEASVSGRASLVQFLVVHGADVNARDKYGFSALDYAYGRYQHDFVPSIINILKRAGAKEEP